MNITIICKTYIIEIKLYFLH